MRSASVAVVALSLLAALTAAAVAPTKKADETYLKRQKDILRLYTHVEQPILYKDLAQIAKTYTIEESHYNDVEVARRFLDLYRFHYYLPRGEVFSIFDKKYFEQTKVLVDLLIAAKDYDTFYKTALYFREYINEAQFVYALTVAVYHREDTKDLVLPPPYEVYPQLFVDTEYIQKAYDAVLKGVAGTKDAPYYVYANYTGYPTARNPEARLSYFREDVGLNSFFAYLHYRYPYYFSLAKGKDVFSTHRGDLFYSFLRILLGRYNLERLANGLPEVEPVYYDKPVKTGYYPEIRLQNGVEAPVRPEGVYPRDTEYLEVEYVKNIEKRIRDSIDIGYVYNEHMEKIPLDEEKGVHILANIIEGNYDSINRDYYGSFYQYLLNIFGNIDDPKHRYEVSPSVLEVVETARRDPLYYRIIRRVLGLFEEYKDTLPAYTRKDIIFPGVKVESVNFDKLVTFFEDFEYSVANTINVASEEDAFKTEVRVRQPRLNHKPFTYRVAVDSDKDADVYVRVFLGPRADYLGRRLSLDEKRDYFSLLDVFKYKLNSGKNVIERSSKDFRYLGGNAPSFYELYTATEGALKGEKPFYPSEYRDFLEFPRRLVVPKGSREGLPLAVYVVVTPVLDQGSEFFADRKPAFFPFDRRLYDFAFDVPNFGYEDVYVLHRDVISS